MLVLKSWLEDYVDIKLSNEDLSDKLSLTGTSIEEIKSKLDPKIIVAQILSINPHPNADRLQIAKVFNGSEELQIVCGAPNIKVGQKVPLATIGAKIQDFEIKQAQIRGIDSFGMMCSNRELSLGEDHDGIKILPEDYEVGKPLNYYIESDTILDIEITPNRGDCLSHLGIAREISAVTGEKLKNPKLINLNIESSGKIKVEIEAKDLCLQYSAILIKGVKVGESPKWLKDRLMALGARSINNIVDITNYIMLDRGQPIHAFDAGKVSNNNIIVRQSKNDEKIVTLDGQVRLVPDNSIVIADVDKAIALAGVMGGANSQVDNDTVDIIIESAEFDPATVRKTSKLSGLSTDASYRFERGIDSGSVFDVAKYAAKLVTEIGGGTIEDVLYIDRKNEKSSIEIEYDKINSLLGFQLTKEKINQILIDLGFELIDNRVSVPYWRHDISIWQDLAEEIGRVYGYEKITPIPLNSTKIIEEADYYKKNIIKNELKNIGFSETVNYVFVSAYDAQLDQIDEGDLLEIKNPMQSENRYLRNSLIPGLIKNVAKNPSFDPILLFEIGHIFDINNEKVSLAIIAAGKNSKKNIEQAKNLLREKLKINDDLELVEITKEKLDKFKIRKSSVLAFEVELDEYIKNLSLTENIQPLESSVINFSYKQVSKYPPLVRDLAFVVSDDVKADEMTEYMSKLSEKILLIELFDEFSSPIFGIKKKNVAFHIYLQDINKALIDVDADQIMKNIISQIQTKFKAILRD